MGDASYVRSSFLGGEWSKFLAGRYERPDYVTALNVCFNGLPIETGTWVRRPGFQSVGTTRNGVPGRLIKFDFQAANPYQMELSDGHLRLWGPPAEGNGASLVPSEIVGVFGLSGAGILQVNTQVTWQTLDQIYLAGLDVTNAELANRAFKLTRIDATHFNLTDSITLELIAGISTTTFPPGAVTACRVVDFVTPYGAGQWATLRSVQTDKTAFLLQGGVAPQALNVLSQPKSFALPATFSFGPATFNDGPYLDPFANGAMLNPDVKNGIVTMVMSFPPYDATKAYRVGDFVTDTSQIPYISLVDQNINHTPAGSPTQWHATSAGEAVAPGGFQGTDIGRLVRLFSEPDLWKVGTSYSTNDVVSYNPSNIPGATTYWKSLTNGNVGHAPGTDVVNWAINATNPAIWTWGKIVQVGTFSVTIGGGGGSGGGPLTGGTPTGNMTFQGGVASAFDGVNSKLSSASAVFTQTSLTLDSYVGKDFTSGGGRAVGNVTVYPSSNDGFFAVTAFIDSRGVIVTPALVSLVINLRGKASAPGSPADGTLLATVTLASNQTSPVNLVSNDQTTTFNFLWVEVALVLSTPAGDSSQNSTDVAQLLLFAPVTSGGGGSNITGAGIQVQIIGAPLLYTTPIRTWRLGVYSDTTGWPTCGTYSDGRLWLAGAVPNRVDSSMSNGITGGSVNFAPTDPTGLVTAAHAISYTFNAPDANPIFWMEPDLQGIMCGTKGGEWVITAPTAGGITALNISARRVTKIGCADIEPEKAEHTLLFVQKFGRKIMEFFPDVFSGKFTAPHITFTGKHLTKPAVVEIAYQRELAPVLWARRSDGLLIGCTYKRDTLSTSQPPTIAAWHRHQLGSGRAIESISIGASNGGNLDALLMITNDAATNVRHVEMMFDIADEGSTLSQAQYLDDAIAATISSQLDELQLPPFGGLRIYGLSRHNGKTVTAWLGGMDCGDHVVADGLIQVPYGDGLSADGLFTLAFVNSFAGFMPMLIGFSYPSQARILKPNSREESGARSGPGFGKLARQHQFAVQLEGTQGVSFGPDFSNLTAATFEHPNGPVYAVTEQFTGIYRSEFEQEDGLESTLCWFVDRPYIVNVVAIGGFIETKDQ